MKISVQSTGYMFMLSDELETVLLTPDSVINMSAFTK